MVVLPVSSIAAAVLSLFLLCKIASSLSPLHARIEPSPSRRGAFDRSDGDDVMCVRRPAVKQDGSSFAAMALVASLPAIVVPIVFWSAAPPMAWSADVAHGATLFQSNCAGCHVGGQNVINEKRTLQQDALEKYLGTTDAVKIQSFVQNQMPHKLLPMKTPMGDDDYLDVATFVSEQALGAKW